MRNQPKYNFIKNTSYALKGLKELFKNETSFKIEIIFCFLLIPFIFFIETNLTNKIIMFITLFLVPLVESLNGAIERVVDLITLEHNEMAGKAKDAGSAAVFISIFICSITWFFIIFN